MFSGQDLINDLDNEIELLKKDVAEYTQSFITLAIAENNYRQKLSTKILELMVFGYENTKIPKSATENIARGIPEIAKLREQKDIADGVNKGLAESINSRKKIIDILKLKIWGTFAPN